MFRVYSRRLDRKIFTRINRWLGERDDKIDPAALKRFVKSGKQKSINQFYSIPASTRIKIEKIHWYPFNYNLRFCSAISTPYLENNQVYGDFYANYPPSAPAAVLLSGWLDSNTDYTRLAHWTGLCGRNLWAIDIPYHGRRTPHGVRSGELAITSDLVRTLGGVRQAVTDARVLINGLWELGSRDIVVMGFSLGGWIGSLLSLVEPRMSRAVLVTPVVRPDRLISKSPYFTSIRNGVGEDVLEFLFSNINHLFLPLEKEPLLPPDNIHLVGSIDDPLAPPRDVKELSESWRCSHEIIPGGHVTAYFTARMWRRLFSILSTRSTNQLN